VKAPLPERLIAILARERRAGAMQLRDVHALSLEERVEAGEAVKDLAIVSSGKDGYTLSCPEFVARFRAGDALYLGDGTSIDAGAAVVFREYDPLRAQVLVDHDRFAPARAALVARAGVPFVLDRRDADFADRTIQAVRALFQSPTYAAARELLIGRALRDQAVERIAGIERARAQGLDATQSEAFVAACTQPFAFVQGPPGAGKTRLAAAIIGAFVAAGRRVLVTAFTHRAVNNVLDAVARANPDAPIIKIGAERQFEGLDRTRVQPIPSARALREPDGACVVGVTTHAAPGLLGQQFDLALVDEAGQVSLAHACAVLPLARRLVCVGDHLQLPPLVIAEHRDPIARRSLFQHMHELYGSFLLSSTYRMNAELCDFPSRAFYGGRLVAAAGNATQRLTIAGDVSPILAPEPPAVIVPQRHRGARVMSDAEARLAADLVVSAVRGGVPAAEIAVIAPHRAHGNRIRALLRRSLPDLSAEHLPVVDTVERLQGGERDLIVLSFAASDPQAVLGEAQFFFSPNRLNVSLTRARKKLVVLLSERLLDAYPDDPESLRGSDLLRRLWTALPKIEAPASATAE
jgi:DNA replication ATP-dependent helicase Dna2